MANIQLEYHPLAIKDGRKAKRWYQKRSTQAAVRFEKAVQVALDQVREDPERWPSYPDGTRFRRLAKFPYLIVYQRLDFSRIQIVAIAHSRRRLGYWSRRK